MQPSELLTAEVLVKVVCEIFDAKPVKPDGYEAESSEPETEPEPEQKPDSFDLEPTLRLSG